MDLVLAGMRWLRLSHKNRLGGAMAGMGDDPASGSKKAADGASSTDALAKLKEQLTKALAGWPGADNQSTGGDVKETPSAAQAVPAADAIRADAQKKYDGIIRWIVGVFAAFGLLIFGSVPFTDLKGIDWAFASWGLGLAGAGIAVVIWATTTGLEPADISLGELAKSLDRSGPDPDNATISRPRALDKATAWIRRTFGPRTRANNRIYDILSNPNEAQAHLGPGIKSINDLLAQIGDLQKAVMLADFNWDGKGKIPAENKLKNAATYRSTIMSEASVDLATAVKALVDVVEGRAALAKQEPETRTEVARRIGRTDHRTS